MSGDISRINPAATPPPAARPMKLDFTDQELSPLDVLVAPETDPLHAGMPGMTIGGGFLGAGVQRATISGEISRSDQPEQKQTMQYELTAAEPPADTTKPLQEVPLGTTRSEVGDVVSEGSYKFGPAGTGVVQSKGPGEHTYTAMTRHEMAPADRPDGLPGSLTTIEAGPYKLVYTTRLGPLQMEDPNAPAPGAQPGNFPATRYATVYDGHMEDTRTGQKTPLHMEMTTVMGDPQRGGGVRSELTGHFGDLPIRGEQFSEWSTGRTLLNRTIGDYTVSQEINHQYRRPSLLPADTPYPET